MVGPLSCPICYQHIDISLETEEFNRHILACYETFRYATYPTTCGNCGTVRQDVCPPRKSCPTCDPNPFLRNEPPDSLITRFIKWIRSIKKK